MNRTRLDRLREELREAGLAGVFLVPGPNFLYFTGVPMSMSERITLLAVPAQGEPAMLAPLLESDKLREMSGLDEMFAYSDEEGPQSSFAQLVEATNLSGSLGAEFYAMRLAERQLLAGQIEPLRLEDATPIIARLRMVKDVSELAAMEDAVELTESILWAAVQAIGPGMREKEIAELVQREMVERGVGLAHFVSVASGPRSALPHAQPTDRMIHDGDLVWIDMGAAVRGYYADITRTVAVGRLPPQLEEAYRVVYSAQEEARNRARPGMTAHQVDALCRDYIEAQGLGRYFIHRTGHGLGLEIHEPPYIVRGSDLVLTPGMTFTIEPGVYLPGLGGVRIEDDVVMVEGGCRSLTSYQRDLLS